MDPHLELGGTALAAHGVAAGAEGRVDLALAAEHAQHGLLELAQLLLEGAGLLAAEALTAAAAGTAFRGLQGRVRGAGVASGQEVHHTRIIQSPPGVVICLLGGSFNIEDILFAQVDVFIQKERSQVALQVSAVLHHDGTGHRVTPIDRDATPNSVLTGLGVPTSRTLNAAVSREAHVLKTFNMLVCMLKNKSLQSRMCQASQ